MTAGAGGVFSFGVRADVRNATQEIAQLEQRVVSLGAAAVRSLNLRFDIINKQTALADINNMEQAVRGLQQRFRAQGIDVPIRVNTQAAEKDILNFKSIAEGSLRGLFRGTGFGGGVPIGLGFGVGAASIVAAGQATEALTRNLIQGFQAGIQYNSMLEQSTLQLTRYTGSATAAGKVIADLTKYADVTPFGTEETIKVGTELLRVTDGNIEKMQELLKLTGALAVTNPYQGLEGASYAVRELLAGDTQSFADRFNVSRTLLQQLRREATDTTDFVRLAVSATGGSTQLIEGLSQTFQGRLSTIQSFIAQLGQSFTAGFFQQMSAAAGEATNAIDEHGQAWKDTAEGVGVAAAGIVGYIGSIIAELLKLVNLDGILPNFQEMGQKAREQRAAEDRAQVPVQKLPEYDAASKVIKEGNDAIHEQQVKLDDISVKLKENAVDVQRINIEEKQITEEYKKQLEPLERRLELLQRPDYERQQRIANLDVGIGRATLAGLQAGPSPELQGQVAAERVILDVKIKQQQLDNKRAEIAQQAIDAANRGKSALEQQAEAQDKIVKKLQEEHQAAQDARAVRLEGLREEVQLVQESRRERLDALREEQRAAQEARREAIDSLREEQRTAQEQRNEQLDAIKETHRAEAEALQDLDREREAQHKAQMSRYQDQIDKLREQLDAQRDSGKTPAEQQLAALDKQEAAYQRSQALADALRGIREADTIKSRLDKLRQLKELQHEQEVAVKREQLQAQIEKEKEDREKAREAIQDKINALERKGREEDRAYQKERDAARAQAEDQQRAAQKEERELEKANREQDRAEAKALRELEQQDRQKNVAEAKALREEERQAREADKADQAALRAEERTAREQERQEQAKIRDEQKREQELTKAAQDQRDAQQLARQQAEDQRQAAISALELQRLELEQRLIDGQDTAAVARAEGEKTRLEAIKAIEVAEGNITDAIKAADIAGLQKRINEIKDAEYQRLIAVKDIKNAISDTHDKLELSKLEAQAIEESLKNSVGHAQALQANLRGQGGQGAEGGDAGGDAADAAAAAVQTGPTDHITPIGKSILERFIPNDDERQRFSNEINQILDDTLGSQDEILYGFGKRHAKGWIDGLIEGLDNGPDSVVGSLKWFTQGIWDFITGFWREDSPSLKMKEEFAGGLIDGAVKGLEERGEEIGNALKAPFENVNIGDTIENIKNDIIDRWNGITTSLDDTRQNLIDSLTAPFRYLTDTYLPSLGPLFDGSGQNAVISWINGWNSNSPVTAVSNAFNQLSGNFFAGINDFFRTSGWNSGISWTNGWSDAYNAWIKNGWGAVMGGVQAAQTAGSNLVQSGSNFVQNAQSTVGGFFSGSTQTQTRDPNIVEVNGVTFNISTEAGIRDYNEAAALAWGPEQRHSGGQTGPGSLYQLQNGEWLAQFEQPGTIIPNGVMSRLGNTSTNDSGTQGVSVAVNIHPGAVQVTSQGIDETGLSDRIGQRVVMAITGAIDEAQRVAPRPAKKTLPGA
jgi:aspartate beta-hydroxylase